MNELEHRIHTEIAEKGGIPFSRFMELALYEPGLGYYETHREIGRKGDFYTSVNVGSVFGEMLGFQFASWLQEIEGNVQLVEAGAHDGRLAGDIMTYLRDWQPEFYSRCELILWESSNIHRNWQQETLSAFDGKVRWVELLEPFRGVFFCNELLDACPVERLTWEAGGWEQGFVKSKAESFVWVNQSAEAVKGWLKSVTPPDRAVYALSDYAPWQNVCESLQQGRAVVVDYGMSGMEFFDPPRKNGTIRGYHHHQKVDDVLQNPGNIDITASVNFSAVEQIATSAGLTTASFARQAQFLVNIFERTLKMPEQFPEWTPDRTRQFQTLVHPEHLGHSFKVLECWRP